MTIIIDHGKDSSSTNSFWKRVLGIPSSIRATIRARRESELLRDLPSRTFRDIGITRGEFDFGVVSSHVD